MYGYDPATNAWDAEPLALPEKLRNQQVKNGFYDPALNVVFLHVACDSRDNSVIWAYRYRKPKSVATPWLRVSGEGWVRRHCAVGFGGRGVRRRGRRPYDRPRGPAQEGRAPG